MKRFLRKFFWIATLPFTAVAVVFALSNRHTTPVDLFPLPFEEVHLPTYALVLVSVAVGFVLGGIAAWFAGGSNRRRGRRERRRADALAREVLQMNERMPAKPTHSTTTQIMPVSSTPALPTAHHAGATPPH